MAVTDAGTARGFSKCTTLDAKVTAGASLEFSIPVLIWRVLHPAGKASNEQAIASKTPALLERVRTNRLCAQ